ncbi:MAG: hypothetical protein DMF23_07155 [Verrucomicrobia bacterium]|nr:MAG: hypothetical protein DMF23_07155 [Verrucomicrobiota bacterium]
MPAVRPQTITTLQMASLSGNQFDQRGKKFAIKLAARFQTDPPPPIFLQDKIGEKSWRFQMSKWLRLHALPKQCALIL